MKKIVLPLLIVWTLSILSCDNKEGISKRHASATEYRTVGHQIPTEVGLRWIDLYNKKNSTQNRIGLSPYSIDGSVLEDLSESVSELTGIAYHYGIDANGTTHIIAIAIDPSLRLWTSIPGRMYVDANTSEEITQAQAQTWADAYKAQNPNAIWFHYFGQNVLSDILATSSFTGLDIIPALSDLDLSPQMLLIVNTSLGILDLGRTAGETPIYDASYPCPRCEAQ